MNPSAALPQNQPNCLNAASTGLIDCGNWAVGHGQARDGGLGIYFAKLVRADNGGASHIVFIRATTRARRRCCSRPRTPPGRPTTTTAATAYTPSSAARKVSYNRPFRTRSVDNGQDWLFSAEYPMVRWLESNGYDVAYISGLDSHRAGALLRNHRVFCRSVTTSTGPAASGPTSRRRAPASTSRSSAATRSPGRRAGSRASTARTPRTARSSVTRRRTPTRRSIRRRSGPGTWRDPRFSLPSDGGRPENGLTGTLFMVNDGATTSIVVPAADGKMAFLAQHPAFVGSEHLGDGAERNPGLAWRWPRRRQRLSPAGADSPVDDDGAGPPGLRFDLFIRTATHGLTLYRHASGALVFGAGTVQWVWASTPRTTVPVRRPTPACSRQPSTCSLAWACAAACVRASARHRRDIAADLERSHRRRRSALAVGTPVTISGSASDSARALAGNQISLRGTAGTRRSCPARRTPPSSGTFIDERAVDDSATSEAPGALPSRPAGGPPCETTAPTVSAVSPAPNATGVARNVSLSVTFSEAIDPSTINSTTLELRNASTNALVAATVSYEAATARDLNPTANLAARTRFTATVRGGATDPRVKDLAGNPLAGSLTWSFTTR